MRQKLICTYKGRCVWHDIYGYCGAYCPHEDERKLYVRTEKGQGHDKR